MTASVRKSGYQNGSRSPENSMRVSRDTSDRVSSLEHDKEELLQPYAFALNEEPHMLVICAEPGMGKTHLAMRMAREALDEGRQVFQCSYPQEQGAQVKSKLVRRCRDMRIALDLSKRPLVVIDGIAPADESEVASEALALERLAEAGAQVVVCMRPEAEQLAESLSHARRMDVGDLLYRGDEESVAYALTAGIPALVMGYRGDAAMGEKELPGPRYMTAMRSLVSESLRPGLMHEELRIRLAMVILGHANLEDMSLVSGRCDTEQLMWLERDAPLFGVDARQGTCSCHGLCRDEVFEGCLGSLQGVAATEPDLVKRACGVLAMMGEARRSAIACRLCASAQDFTAVCVTWGVAYVSIGEASMVEGALRAVRPERGQEGMRLLLSRAAATCVLGTAREVDEAFEALSEPSFATTAESRLYRMVQLLGTCRNMLRSPVTMPEPLPGGYQDAVMLACLDHLKAMRLIVAGRFGEAYSIITSEMLMSEPSCLPEAFLCDDLMLALALHGGVPDAKERALSDGAERMYARPGLRGMRVYHDALVAAPDILMADGVDNGPLVEAAARAERQGDSFFQAVCLAIAAVADVRSHALSRAHVRASKAAEICRALSASYVASSAELIDALALELLGEPNALGHYCDQPNHPKDLALIGLMVARVVGDVPASGPLSDIPLGTPCPRDAFWAINLLRNGCGDIWRSLTGIIPSTWIELLRAVSFRRERRERSADASGARLDKAPFDLRRPARLGEGSQTDLALQGTEDGRIRITVLGGFSVECNGRRVPEGAFERRRARDLVTLLAIVPGHRIRRYQAIETLWPQTDYYRGPRKLYEATGEARVRLAELCASKANAIVADRTQGSIGFDTSMITVDVDEFEAEARMTLSEDGDDFWVLEHARCMERLYGSGPDEHLSVLGDLVTHRVDELRTMYVDGAVAAGEAALRLGKAKLAVRYGTDAHRMGDLREDAMILLVRALKMAGRGYEIVALYKRYSQRLIEARGIPPSLALRRVVEQAVGDGPDLHTM